MTDWHCPGFVLWRALGCIETCSLTEFLGGSDTVWGGARYDVAWLRTRCWNSTPGSLLQISWDCWLVPGNIPLGSLQGVHSGSGMDPGILIPEGPPQRRPHSWGHQGSHRKQAVPRGVSAKGTLKGLCGYGTTCSFPKTGPGRASFTNPPMLCHPEGRRTLPWMPILYVYVGKVFPPSG